MKESDPQHLASIESASAAAAQEKTEHDNGEQPLDSFVALRRLSKVQVEAVRMQGCADGAGAY
jgi:hypothetical protein